MTNVISVTPEGKQKLVSLDTNPNMTIDNVQCVSSVAVGDPVIMINSIAYVVDGSSFDTSNAIGVCESKPTSTICTIRFSGVTEEIYTGLDEAEEYFIKGDNTGGLTVTPPTAVGTVRLKMGQPFSPTRMLIMKGERMVRA